MTNKCPSCDGRGHFYLGMLGKVLKCERCKGVGVEKRDEVGPQAVRMSDGVVIYLPKFIESVERRLKMIEDQLTAARKKDQGTEKRSKQIDLSLIDRMRNTILDLHSALITNAESTYRVDGEILQRCWCRHNSGIIKADHEHEPGCRRAREAVKLYRDFVRGIDKAVDSIREEIDQCIQPASTQPASEGNWKKDCDKNDLIRRLVTALSEFIKGGTTDPNGKTEYCWCNPLSGQHTAQCRALKALMHDVESAERM